MIVLAGAIILALNNSGVIGKASMSRAKSDLSTLMEEVQLKVAERKLNGLDVDGMYKLSEWGIKNSIYENRVIIDNGKLRVLNSDEDDDIKKAAIELEIMTNTASTILKNTTGKKLLNYRIYGNSVQNGIPTLDNPVEIQSLGHKTKNLFDAQGWYKWLEENTSAHYNYLHKELKDNINCIFYRPSAGWDLHYMEGLFKENTQYTIKWRAKANLKPDGRVSTGFVFVYTDGTKSMQLVPSEDKWDSYTLISDINKTINHIQMWYHSNDGIWIDENSIQLEEGTTVADYESYGYKIPVKVSGKNLLNINRATSNSFTLDETKYINGGAASNLNCYPKRVDISISNGKISVNSKDGGYGAGYILKVNPNTNYTLSFETNKISSGSYVGLNLISTNNELGKYVAVSSKKYTITTQNDTKYLYIVFRFPPADGEVEYSNIQLEKGDTVTDYTVYQSPVITNIYLKEPLRKVAEYADYIDFKNKKVVRNVTKQTYNGSENWSDSGASLPENYTQYVLKNDNILPSSYNNIYIKPIVNRLEGLSNRYWKNRNQERWYTNRAFYNIRPVILKSRLSEDTVNGFKQWLNANPITALYPLATPTEETISLPYISTLNGTTIISVVGENGVEASNILVEY